MKRRGAKETHFFSIYALTTFWLSLSCDLSMTVYRIYRYLFFFPPFICRLSYRATIIQPKSTFFSRISNYFCKFSRTFIMFFFSSHPIVPLLPTHARAVSEQIKLDKRNCSSSTQRRTLIY